MQYICRALLIAALLVPVAWSWGVVGAGSSVTRGTRSTHRLYSSSSSSSSSSPTTTTSTDDDDDLNNNNPLGLTPELNKVTNAFQSICDDKLRYKQLLYMANQLAPMDDALKTPDNVVPGCLSTVHVYATLKDDDTNLIYFQGDSDGLLTKGLVALLIRGLSGNTAEDIQKVDPKFIEKAGISASLTPGRNNGFLNMLRVMKQQAMSAVSVSSSGGGETTKSETPAAAGSKYDAILQALEKLQPTHIELVDNSHQHAGHAGNDMDGESHFDLFIVSEAFDGLNLVKRHKLVYMMLGEIMPKIHALQIRAQTPSEANL
jgi:sulfur transfer protein SufE/stress-induced morphogen